MASDAMALARALAPAGLASALASFSPARASDDAPYGEGATPATVVWRRRGARLLRYGEPRDAAAPARLPLLIVPSMINRHYILDLLPEHSFVAHLVDAGHDVYLLDWDRPLAEDRWLDFDGVIEDVLAPTVRRVQRDAGGDRVQLLGYCMGGTLCAIYAALHPERVAALVNLAGPIDFSQAGVLGLWTDPRWFDADKIIDALGSLPGSMMQSSFLGMSPTSYPNKALALYDKRGDKAFMRRFIAMETWANDNIDFPGETYRRYIRELYQDNALVRGVFTIRGRAARLEAIDCPVLSVCAASDTIVPRPSAEALVTLCGSDDAEVIELPGGHVGMVVGRRAPAGLWTTLSSWLHERAGAAAA